MTRFSLQLPLGAFPACRYSATAVRLASEAFNGALMGNKSNSKSAFPASFEFLQNVTEIPVKGAICG